MKKEFGFKNYFLYVCRYWLVTAICAVVGIGAMLGYGIISRPDDVVTYEGNVRLAGISTFFGNDSSDTATEYYYSMRGYALDLMTSSAVRNDLYSAIGKEWEALNPKLAQKEAQAKFFDSLSVSRTEYMVTVAFSQQISDEAHDAFSQKAVNEYLRKAEQIVCSSEPRLKEEGSLAGRAAELKFASSYSRSTSLLVNCLEGLVAGVVLGLVIMVVVYFADRRVNSYGDIAEITGGRLLAANKAGENDAACPIIDRASAGAKVIALCGSKEACKAVSSAYADYLADSDYKTLFVDMSESGKLSEYLHGGELSACVDSEGKYSTVSGDDAWKFAGKYADRVEKLNKDYERVVICAPYRADGSLAVIAGVADKIVYVLDQSRVRMKEVAAIAYEAQAEDKAAGAVLTGIGKSFVGEKTYFAGAEEE